MKTQLHYQWLLTSLFAIFLTNFSLGQSKTYLRGDLRAERNCFDVNYYNIDLDLNLENKTIRGSVKMKYTGQFNYDTIQIDLDSNLVVESIFQSKQKLSYKRVKNSIFIHLFRSTCRSIQDSITINYFGKPQIAVNAPWDGGFSWKKDSLNRPFIGVSCEGIGASIWWPNKDHLIDEPDSVKFSMTVPNPLRMVSNGTLIGTQSIGRKKTRFSYKTSEKINNYNITFYVGNYITFTDTLHSQEHETPLKLTYSVLDYNQQRAKEHFKQVKPMLRCFENILAPYPFWEDGYKIVEAPYLGMEHQSAIAYGNKYMRGYLGKLIPEYMNWDYLIIHESAHEYFGNSLSISDMGEMWLHESFTTYMEALYVECQYSKEDYLVYINSQKPFIAAKSPILKETRINYHKYESSDHYYKGALLLHTFRTMVGDKKFLQWLKSFYLKHEKSTVTTNDFYTSIVNHFGPRYLNFWRNGLENEAIPLLKIYSSKDESSSIVHFERVMPGFKMPILIGEKEYWIDEKPTSLELNKKDWNTGFNKDLYLIEIERN